MKIITISGHAGNGKDSLGMALSEILRAQGNRVVVMHYADHLKNILRSYYGWDGKKDEKGRALLQHIGTDVVHPRDKYYWTRVVIELIKIVLIDDFDYVIIPDARFPHEINEIRKAGFDVTSVHITREGYENTLTPEQRAHISETALDDFPFDEYVVVSDGLDEVKKAAHELVGSWAQKEKWNG